MSVSAIANQMTNQYQARVENERTMLALKKTQDATKDQGQALAELVKSTTDQIGQMINVYA